MKTRTAIRTRRVQLSRPTRRTSISPRRGLNDPRAVQIPTTEHWSLLSTRTLGYNEMFGRASILVTSLSGTVCALALLAQATGYRTETLSFAALLIAVVLFVGVATFVRCVAVNYEDARWVDGMNLLRRAYLQIVPELEPFFVTGHDLEADQPPLSYGSGQRLFNLANSLTTTPSVIGALDSVLAGSLASALSALFGANPAVAVTIGAGVSVVSADVRYAAWFRRSHAAAPRIARFTTEQ